ncbi:mechanosensitive ion channel [Nocardioides zeae]|uniref:Mechanosensitive ion channel n=1 Tax=Nocardioides imazamoxiresistens TaxID=3231893 RepID=A0ABU3Q112_9ACTN|nr:mechanosensitive ion channel domain-containing protein [Nocardioides zeae]MDT9595179.1 mechanosensitive ion channel [Nocardioides zeae]
MPPASSDLLVSVAVVVAVSVAIGAVVPFAVRRLGRRWPPAEALVRAARFPFRVLVLVVGLNAVVAANRPRGDGAELWDTLALALRILGIINGAWLLAVVMLFAVDAALRRADAGLDPRNAKRVRTQVQVTRRVVVVAIVFLALGAILLSFPGVRAVGASLLASAGLVSVVAALAAQSTLGNLFAGLQLAFSDAIRIDDTVIVDEEYGTIEEITLSYVVVKTWDDRRVVLPCTYFTTTPFENWTRKDTEMIGTVLLQLDWRTDLSGLRAEFERLLDSTPLYNGRSSGMVVTDATQGLVTVRASVTADDPGLLWDLQCLVREGLVTWVREHDPEALPRQRWEIVPGRHDGQPTGRADHAA